MKPAAGAYFHAYIEDFHDGLHRVIYDNGGLLSLVRIAAELSLLQLTGVACMDLCLCVQSSVQASSCGLCTEISTSCKVSHITL